MNEHHNGLSVKDKHYLHNYLPQTNIRDIKHIEIIINELSLSEGYHSFKNTYIRGKDFGDTYVYEVCSPLGIKQVVLAINTAVREGMFNPTVNVQQLTDDVYNYQFEALTNDLQNIQRYVDCSDKVVFGRSASIKDWFIKDTLAKLNVDYSTIDELFIHKENIRLLPMGGQKDIFKGYLNSKIYAELFKIVPKEIVSIGRVSGFKINYNNNTIAVLDRPWGRDMAYVFAKEITQSSKPSAIGIVGGCGSLNNLYLIESVVNPSNVYSPECGLVSLHNRLYNFEAINVFNIDSPFLETNVFLEDLVQKDMHFIEMELAGFRKGIPEDVAIYCSLYVMDEPLKGLTLNETYYDPNFLKILFSTKDRAKDKATKNVIKGILK